MSKVYKICNCVESANGIAFGGGGGGGGGGGSIYSNANYDCYTDSATAVISTAAAVAAPNPLTVANAAYQWGAAINTCTNKD
ncbi:hypothetical protein QTN94_17775 [Vibrio sp. M250220]|uniref:hypothetical protein n=1 Tax=Vibrio sp. M250220 TaxID=3020894 RepID=UPI002F3FEB23